MADNPGLTDRMPTAFKNTADSSKPRLHRYQG